MGILFMFIYIAIILAVIEINTILFKLTGLDQSVARFQVISMLTGTGFTTGESELIIEHPIRRKLGAFLILFGAFSLAVIISAITNVLSSQFYAEEIGYIAGVLILLILVLKIPMLQMKLTKMFKTETEQNYHIADLPIRDVLLTNDKDKVVDIPIYEKSPYIGKSFREIITEDEDIMVLFIQRGAIKIRNRGFETKLRAGDRAFLYGDKETIDNKFKEELKNEKEMNPLET